MGQVLRRAIGKGRTSTLDRPTVVVASKKEIPKKEEARFHPPEHEPITRSNIESTVLEERDPEYDAMLRQMVGRITSKPGSKFEMGEASVVQRYNRPMPKLRDTKSGVARDDERAVPPGMLNVAHLRKIFLLLEGKAEGQSAPMDAKNIAKTLKLEEQHVHNILKFLSLPPEVADSGQNQG